MKTDRDEVTNEQKAGPVVEKQDNPGQADEISESALDQASGGVQDTERWPMKIF